MQGELNTRFQTEAQSLTAVTQAPLPDAYQAAEAVPPLTMATSLFPNLSAHSQPLWTDVHLYII